MCCVLVLCDGLCCVLSKLCDGLCYVLSSGGSQGTRSGGLSHSPADLVPMVHSAHYGSGMAQQPPKGGVQGNMPHTDGAHGQPTLQAGSYSMNQPNARSFM